VFEIAVYLNGLGPNTVRVELYADGEGDGPVRQEMERIGQPAGTGDGSVYRAQMPATRPATDYTARAIPRCEGLTVPLEDGRILWQR
jgi:starch phosphorylase